MDFMHFSNDQLAIINSINESALKEVIKDFFSNQTFRRDYWVKGLQNLTVAESHERIGEIKIILTRPASEIPKSFRSMIGEITINDNEYEVVRNIISDYKPHFIKDIVASALHKGISSEQVLQVVLLFVGSHSVYICQNPVNFKNTHAKTKAHNDYVINYAKFEEKLEILASPITGGGIGVNRTILLFMLAEKNGCIGSEMISEFVYDMYSSQGVKMKKNDLVLITKEDAINELKSQAEYYLNHNKKILQALKIN